MMQVLSGMGVANCYGEALAPSVPEAWGTNFLIKQFRKSAHVVAETRSDIAVHWYTSQPGLPFERPVATFTLSAGRPDEFRAACQIFVQAVLLGFGQLRLADILRGCEVTRPLARALVAGRWARV